MFTTSVKLSPAQMLTIYSYIFTIKAPSIGMDRDFNKILDKLTEFGLHPNEDGSQILANGLPNLVQMDFNKLELGAMKYAILLRLNPDPKNEYQVPMGVARMTLWPLCKALGIEEDVRRALPAAPAIAENDNAGVMLDSEYVK